MHQSHVLVVEDEPEIAELIRLNVEREGFKADVVHAGEPAVEFVQQQQPDLVLLDLMLPDINGLEVCRRLKWEEATRNVPIIMVTARGEESDVVAGLEMGADDYVTKPFRPRVLAARMKNVLRRVRTSDVGAQAPDSSVLQVGPLRIDLDRHQITVGGARIQLTMTEFQIVRYLCERPGIVRTRDQIINQVHGELAVLSARTIDVHITAIRRKFGEVGKCIETVRGVGYRIEFTSEDPVTP